MKELSTDLWMPAGGLMGSLIRATDWSETPLGAIECWPEVLRLTTGICLDSQFAIGICWGPQLTQIYNDAYRALIGENRHRTAFALPGHDMLQEMLPTIDAIVLQVMERGEAIPGYDLRLVIERNGYPEERYFTFSFSPVRQSDGNVAGMFIAAHERTAKLLVARRLRDSDARLVAALNAAKMATWEWDLQTDQMIVSDSAKEVYGLLPGDMLQTGAQGYELVHPEDIAKYREMVETAIASKGSWHAEFRIIRARDGAVAWLEERGMTTCNASTGKVGTTGLVWDVTASKRAEEALRIADRRKDEFLATLAHELRNPLAPIRSAAHLLGDQRLTPELLHHCRDIIDRQAGQMTRLLEDLLDVSRITNGRLELRKTRVTLREVIDSAVETAWPMIDIKGHALQIALPDSETVIDADPLRIAQVFTNLLTNAAKYTDRNGCIKLEAQTTGDELNVIISDNGIGVTVSDIPHLFEMFSQVGSAMDRSEGGLGIGLALSKGLLDLHGGKVVAHSQGLGKGMTFVVTLPLAGMPNKVRDINQDRLVVEVSSGQTVLLIDDNRDAIDSFAVILQFSGYRVFVAYSGQDGLAVGARERPHAVILDIGMPQMNGYEVAARIRSAPWGGSALLVAATGWGQEADKRLAKEAGFDRHLTKPFDPKEVLLALTEWLKEKNVEREENQ